MKIREANSKDIDKISSIGKSVREFQVSEDVVTFWPPEVLRKVIKSKTDFVLLAEENKEIVGFIIANYNPNFGKAIIENIFVKPEYRGQNIGEQMLDALMTKLKRIGCGYVCTLIESASKESIDFYTKQGFTRGIDCAWLDKVLSKSFKK